MLNVKSFLSGDALLSVVGLGYVGLPIAVEFSKNVKVIGFDLNKEKIEQYISGKDPTNEVGDAALSACKVEFTSDPARLKDALFHIVAVPTPVRDDKQPDLSPLEGASRLIGRNLSKGSVVVYESTVYPGVTEEFCVPILERESGLACGADFTVGYSPERINPGDTVHRLDTIVKIVSAQNDATLEFVADMYSLVVSAGLHRAPSIKVAEAAKVIENSQRDINIAFMNELSIIFDKMGIDTLEVLKAAETKWNFLSFRPGLVGGHCIGVDPYYLTYKAEQLGYHSQIILAGRRINDNMGAYIAQNAVKRLSRAGKDIPSGRVVILGVTFKENCPDIRNSRVKDIIDELTEFGIAPLVSDPRADPGEVEREYGVKLTPMEELSQVDCLIVAVSHQEFSGVDFSRVLSENSVIIDVKGSVQPVEGCDYWRL